MSGDKEDEERRSKPVSDSSVVELEEAPPIDVNSLLDSSKSTVSSQENNQGADNEGAPAERKVYSRSPGLKDGSLSITYSLCVKDDRAVPKLITMHRHVIVKIIDPAEILPLLSDMLERDTRIRIKNRGRHESPQSAAGDLLTSIEGISGYPDKWRKFVNALKLAGYEYLGQMLSEEGEISEEVYKNQVRVIDLLERHFVDNLFPRDIIPDLRKHDIISDMDRHAIEAETHTNGPIMGMMMLMDKVWRKKRNWYSVLMDAVCKANQSIARKIDEDHYQRWKEGDDEKLEEQYIQEKEVLSGIDENVQKVEETRMITKTASPSGGTDNASRSTVEEDDGEDGSLEDLTPTKELTLYRYQKELADAAIRGKNCITVAPTGSGKTHVAMKIIQHHIQILKDVRIPKVIFLVDKNALASQQYKQIKDYVGGTIKHITGETQRVDGMKIFSKYLERCTILVVTAQILLNALTSQDEANRVEIEQFSLIVFDECHHTNSQHPYNQIMFHYMEAKFREDSKPRKLPQIVGLTASIGTGGTDVKSSAEKYIKSIMANMDAESLCTVRGRDSMREMYQIINENTINTEVVVVEPRRNQEFGGIIQNLMRKIENFMRTHRYKKYFEKEDDLCSPEDKGSEAYTQWVSELWPKISKIKDKDAIPFYHTCRRYLKMLNEALDIYKDARAEDAYELMLKHMDECKSSANDFEADINLRQWFEDIQGDLTSRMKDPGENNPKLVELKKIIQRKFEKNPSSLCLVFAKKRDLVMAIEASLNEDRDLIDKKPVRFVGAQASGEKGGITRRDQDEILQKFREGKHKIVIATSIAEEGLDIPKCNLVIRYDYATNEIAMVQARGRGRAEDSLYIVITTRGSPIDNKEQVNRQREDMMNNAIAKVQEEIERNRETFMDEKEKNQKAAKVIRDSRQEKEASRCYDDGQFEIQCGKCTYFICMSSDIRLIEGVHRVCLKLGSDFTATKSEKQGHVGKNLRQNVGKVRCKCNSEVGKVFIYKNVQFPVIGIRHVLIEDSRGNKVVCKQWKEAPFSSRNLTPDDLAAVARREKLLPNV